MIICDTTTGGGSVGGVTLSADGFVTFSPTGFESFIAKTGFADTDDIIQIALPFSSLVNGPA